MAKPKTLQQRAEAIAEATPPEVIVAVLKQFLPMRSVTKRPPIGGGTD